MFGGKEIIAYLCIIDYHKACYSYQDTINNSSNEKWTNRHANVFFLFYGCIMTLLLII